MHVITRKRLNEFAEKYPDTKNALADWYNSIKKNNFSNFAEMRKMFSSADKVGRLTVFNIGDIKFDLSRRYIIIVKKFTFALF